MFKMFVAGVLFALMAPLPAYAVDSMPPIAPPQRFVASGWKSLHRYLTVTLDRKALGEETFDFEYRAVTSTGVDQIANETFDYDPNFEELRFEGLETVKADGRVIAVDPRAIHDQPARVDSKSPYIDDRREKIVAFPDLEPGDIIRGKSITRIIASPFGDGFTRDWAERADQSDEDRRFVIDAPAELPLRIAAIGVAETVIRRDGRIIRTVEFPKTPPHLQVDAISAWDVGPRYEVTTFASNATFAKAISDLNASRGVADSSIKSEVARIVDGAEYPREKAKRLSNWVASHVRYVGIGLGNGGYVSEQAATTFAARYGDCKAHANLLKTMLAEAGVDAHLALVDTSPSYRAPVLPVNDFDHEIVYLPDFDLFVDPTDSYGVFGAPLLELGGKSALDLATGEMRLIPRATPDDMKLSAQTRSLMSPEGVRSGAMVLTGARAGESYRRWQTTNAYSSDDTKRLAEAMLAEHHYSGSGVLTLGDARRLDQPFAITGTFAEDKPQDVSRLGGWVRVESPIDPTENLATIIHDGVSGRAAKCFPIDYTEINVLTLPDNFKVSDVAPPLTIDDKATGHTALGEVTGSIAIRSAFSVEGHDLKLTNHVRVAFDAPLCSADVLVKVDQALLRWDDYRYKWAPLSGRVQVSSLKWLGALAAFGVIARVVRRRRQAAKPFVL